MRKPSLDYEQTTEIAEEVRKKMMEYLLQLSAMNDSTIDTVKCIAGCASALAREAISRACEIMETEE